MAAMLDGGKVQMRWSLTERCIFTMAIYDGETAHVFNKGDTAYIHQGDRAGWKTTDGTRLIVASYAAPV